MSDKPSGGPRSPKPAEPARRGTRAEPGKGGPLAPDPADGPGVRTAEVIAALSLATDLGTRLPLEHGLESTVVAMRLCDRLGVDGDTAFGTYYAALLFYVGCTAEADVTSGLFPHADALATHFTPVMFGSRPELVRGLLRALAAGTGPWPARAARALVRLPTTVRAQIHHQTAICEVGRMLTRRLGLPVEVQELFVGFTERWDGKGGPGGAAGEEIPLSVRIVHVARDACVHRMLGGHELAARTVKRRAGGAFDPAVADCFVGNARQLLERAEGTSSWNEALSLEPGPNRVLQGEALDEALRAMGDFADLVSPWLVGHSSEVARLAAAAGTAAGLGEVEVRQLRRAGLVHDLGRVWVPARVWGKPGALSTGDWEGIRLHAYHTERVLAPSDALAPLGRLAGQHHERVDGSGYHRGVTAAALSRPARLLAAADVLQAMTEPRPHRRARSRSRAAAALGREAGAGRLDPDAASAVIDAAGEPVPRIRRPADLSEREATVVGLLARGLQTKQVARRLGISAKTADRHIQNAYRKIGVSTRAAAALFAMEHGLARWGELPMAEGDPPT